MATRAQIVELRLTVNDPVNYINIVDVATIASLPASPEAFTAYHVAENGGYYSTILATGAVPGDYTLQNIIMSDARISAIIDTSGIAGAEIAFYRMAVRKLGAQLVLVKNTDGAESSEYQRIDSMVLYYKSLIGDVESVVGANTGRWFVTNTPAIGGGNV